MDYPVFCVSASDSGSTDSNRQGPHFRRGNLLGDCIYAIPAVAHGCLGDAKKWGYPTLERAKWNGRASYGELSKRIFLSTQSHHLVRRCAGKCKWDCFHPNYINHVASDPWWYGDGFTNKITWDVENRTNHQRYCFRINQLRCRPCEFFEYECRFRVDPFPVVVQYELLTRIIQ